jgi:hypothetical protein
MTNDPREIANPLHIDSVVQGSVTVLTSPESPGSIILKVQATLPGQTGPSTFLFYLDPSDAHQLNAALSACLKGSSN